eukprot:CAMPEP_0194300912 /NCGR_PEP_ID=MMETSP0169-20130528/61520_1 /TAXON_ID=218684 /ORGANISM="Corethron pennatum, Strain L29A3" /LENGTH=460 /DNA_ID=CAMNT_0039051135 /DNA_START=5 /DNA_END=1391 /DNA_ORIENTATION=-
MSSGQEVGSIFSADALLRSPAVLAATVALWGMNVHLFRRFGIDYASVIMETEEGHMDGGPPDTGGKAPIEKNPGAMVASASIEMTVSAPTPPVAPKSPGAPLPAPPPPSPAVATLSSRFFFRLAAFLALLLLSAEYLWMRTLRGSSLGAIMLFYGAAASLVIQNEDARTCLGVAYTRLAMLLRPRCGRSSGSVHVAFADVFFADAMCSLSKVFFDWGMIWTMAFYYPEPPPETLKAIFLPSLAASLPYLIRARQCVLCWAEGKLKNDPARYLHLLNALKYSTSLFPLCISAYQKTMTSSEDDQFKVERILVIFLAINAGYSFAWDVVMDWGMAQNPISCATTGGEGASFLERSCMRPRLRFGAVASLAILVADAFLRGSWMLRFYDKYMFSNVDTYVLTTQFLEIFRRAIWNLLRVDWEMVKQIKKRKGKADAVHGDSDEDDGEHETVSLIKSRPHDLQR